MLLDRFVGKIFSELKEFNVNEIEFDLKVSADLFRINDEKESRFHILIDGRGCDRLKFKATRKKE